MNAVALATNVPAALKTSLGWMLLRRRCIPCPAAGGDAMVTPMKLPVHPKIISAAAVPTASKKKRYPRSSDRRQQLRRSALPKYRGQRVLQATAHANNPLLFGVVS